MTVSRAGWVFLFLTTLYFPLVAIRSAFRLRKLVQVPTRAQRVASVMAVQLVMLVPALLAARYEGVTLFPPPAFAPLAIGLAIVFLAVTLGTVSIRWNWKTPTEKRRLLLLLPNSNQDLIGWTLIALTAGIGEEIVYRGVMFTLLLRLFGAWWPAVIVCIVAFSLAHFVQGWRAMVAIGVITLGVHAIVRLTGNLYTAMFVHFVYDVFAGVIMLGLARRDGVLTEKPA